MEDTARKFKGNQEMFNLFLEMEMGALKGSGRELIIKAGQKGNEGEKENGEQNLGVM